MTKVLSILFVQISVIVFSFLVLFPAQPAQAACKGRFLGVIPTWYEYLPVDNTTDCNVEFPTKSTPSGDEINLRVVVTSIAFGILGILMPIAGLVSVIFVIVGGFTFITSAGQPDKAKNARGTILNALIGLVIAMSAAVIVNIVAKALTSGTTP